jgi:hypothetical protein
MSIKKLEMYTVICDSCKKSADEDSQFSCWNDKSYAEDVASDADFRKNGNNHYCANCAYYDDDDNLVIGKPSKLY